MGMKKQTVIIFDGADKCGKSEMAKELSRRLEIPYFKNQSEWDAFSSDPSYFANAMKYGDDFFYRFLRDTGVSCILDRSYPSEWVYSRVYNRSTHNDALTHVDKLASSINVRIVIPYRSSYEGIRDDVHDIDQTYLEKIDSTYLSFMSWTSCPVFRMNVDDENLEREMIDILNFLEKTE
jgi:deoxyadenosine/deoxycytidine kinase